MVSAKARTRKLTAALQQLFITHQPFLSVEMHVPCVSSIPLGEFITHQPFLSVEMHVPCVSSIPLGKLWYNS